MALLHACSGGSGLGAAAAAAGSKPGYVTGTGQYVVVNDAVPNGGNAWYNNFFGELYDPLMPITPTTDWKWVNGFFRMPGVGNVIMAWHHWAVGAGLSYGLVYNPSITSLYLQAFTRPNVIGAVLQGPFVENCAGYRPFSWGVNSNNASPGYRDTTLILWDRAPPTVFANFNGGVAYGFNTLPSPTHQGAFFNPTYQRNLILTDELDDGSGRFVGAIDVRNYPMLSAIPNGDSLQGSQLFDGWDGAAPQAAGFGWWNEVPVTTAGWPDPGDYNVRGVGPGPSHSTFPAAVPPAGTEVAALVMYDHRSGDAGACNFSIFTSEGQSTLASGVLNRTSQLYTPDQWNIRDPGFGNPWNDLIYNTLAAGYQDGGMNYHMQLHLEVVYGPIVAAVTYYKSVAGTLTPSGILTRLTKTSLAGTLTFAGALAVVAIYILSLGGTLSFQGALAAQILIVMALAGTLTFTGTLAMFAKKQVAGILTLSGILTRKVVTSVTGTLPLTGVLTTISTFFASLAGTLSFTGSLTHFTKKAISGVLTLSGFLIAVIALTLSGTLSFVGTLRRTLPVYIAMTLTLVSGRLTNVVKGASLAVATLSGRMGIVRMVLSRVTKLFSGSTPITKKKDTVDVEIVLLSGKASITKESKD